MCRDKCPGKKHRKHKVLVMGGRVAHSRNYKSIADREEARDNAHQDKTGDLNRALIKLRFIRSQRRVSSRRIT